MSVLRGVYRHYKGGLYMVLGTAHHHETRREYVVYTPLEPHGLSDALEISVRPLISWEDDQDAWLDVVEGRPRFELVTPMSGERRVADVRGGRT